MSTSKLERELEFRFPTSYSSDKLLKLDPTSRYIAEIDRLKKCEEALRFLAAMLAAGEYDAPTVDPETFKHKIIWGIRELSKARMAAQPSMKRLDHSETA